MIREASLEELMKVGGITEEIAMMLQTQLDE